MIGSSKLVSATAVSANAAAESDNPLTKCTSRRAMGSAEVVAEGGVAIDQDREEDASAPMLLSHKEVHQRIRERQRSGGLHWWNRWLLTTADNSRKKLRSVGNAVSEATTEITSSVRGGFARIRNRWSSMWKSSTPSSCAKKVLQSLLHPPLPGSSRAQDESLFRFPLPVSLVGGNARRTKKRKPRKWKRTANQRRNRNRIRRRNRKLKQQCQEDRDCSDYCRELRRHCRTRANQALHWGKLALLFGIRVLEWCIGIVIGIVVTIFFGIAVACCDGMQCLTELCSPLFDKMQNLSKADGAAADTKVRAAACSSRRYSISLRGIDKTVSVLMVCIFLVTAVVVMLRPSTQLIVNRNQLIDPPRNAPDNDAKTSDSAGLSLIPAPFQMLLPFWTALQLLATHPIRNIVKTYAPDTDSSDLCTTGAPRLNHNAISLVLTKLTSESPLALIQGSSTVSVNLIQDRSLVPIGSSDVVGFHRSTTPPSTTPCGLSSSPPSKRASSPPRSSKLLAPPSKASSSSVWWSFPPCATFSAGARRRQETYPSYLGWHRRPRSVAN